MNGYSYHWPRSSPAPIRELEMECPCGDGYLTVTVNDARAVVKVVTFGCSKNCEQNYSNGVYDGAIQAAIAEADRIEANGPTESQLQSLYDTAGLGQSDVQHTMREAQRLW